MKQLKDSRENSLEMPEHSSYSPLTETGDIRIITIYHETVERMHMKIRSSKHFPDVENHWKYQNTDIILHSQNYYNLPQSSHRNT